MYAQGKYSRANLLFGEMVTLMKGTENGEECLFMYAMSAYMTKEYDAAAEIFKKYESLPEGVHAHTDNFIFPSGAVYLTIKEQAGEEIAYKIIENAAIKASGDAGKKILLS